MQIHQTSHEGYVTLAPEGDLDANSSVEMDEAIRKCLEEGTVKFHVDCSKLEYISSAGLGVFISFLEEVRNKGGEFVFSGMSDKIFRVFELLGLHMIMKIVADEAEAARQLAL